MLDFGGAKQLLVCNELRKYTCAPTNIQLIYHRCFQCSSIWWGLPPYTIYASTSLNHLSVFFLELYAHIHPEKVKRYSSILLSLKMSQPLQAPTKNLWDDPSAIMKSNHFSLTTHFNHTVPACCRTAGPQTSNIYRWSCSGHLHPNDQSGISSELHPPEMLVPSHHLIPLPIVTYI